MKILVVDDSAVARQTLTARLRSPDLEVACAPTIPLARQRLDAQKHDAVILDLELGRRTGAEPEGLVFLTELIARRVPTIVCSALTSRGSEIAMQALARGAAEVVDKAQAFGTDEVNLVGLVRALRRSAPLAPARVMPSAGAIADAGPSSRGASWVRPPGGAGLAPTSVVCVGSSTGGIEPLITLCSAQRDDDPPFLVVQHIAATVLPAFLRHVATRTRRPVVEVTEPAKLARGRLYFAAPGRHLLASSVQGAWSATTNDAAPVRYHRPSIDLLFESVARLAGERVVAFVLSGMGGDASEGTGDIHRAGGYTVAQDEASSVVYGMAREVVALGHARAVVPVSELPRTLRVALGRGAGGDASPRSSVKHERPDG